MTKQDGQTFYQVMTDWAIKFTAKTRYRGEGYLAGSTITVTAGLHHLAGNARPYWSVTGEIQEPRRRDISAGGCLHDEIARHWPGLQPVIDLHLADDAGKPLYAEINGWYFLSGYYGGAGEQYHAGNTPDRLVVAPPIDSLASHFRITVADAIALADSLKAGCLVEEWGATRYSDLECWRNMKAAFSVYVAAQADRWAAESAAGVALLTRLKTEQRGN